MTFAAAWLDLREPADHAARDPGLLAAARTHLGDGLAVDLGCGTGSTIRAFGTGPARWRLVDRDPALLTLAVARHPVAETAAADLRNLGDLPLAGARLVTASALIDLVSRDWVEALADRLAALEAGLYAALSYDGEMSWTPALPEDAEATAAFNRHQRGNKGFGPALGPDAGRILAQAMARRGYHVRTAPSPWRLGSRCAELRAALTEGVGDAAGAAGMSGVAAWFQARRAAVAGTGSCVVGHIDLLAIPAAGNAQSKITSVSSP